MLTFAYLTVSAFLGREKSWFSPFFSLRGYKIISFGRTSLFCKQLYWVRQLRTSITVRLITDLGRKWWGDPCLPLIQWFCGVSTCLEPSFLLPLYFISSLLNIKRLRIKPWSYDSLVLQSALPAWWETPASVLLSHAGGPLHPRLILAQLHSFVRKRWIKVTSKGLKT